MSHPYRHCKEVSVECPVEATTYGYYPNLAANIVFVVIWSILVVSQSVFGIRYRTWSYSTVLFAGSAMEAIGYGGRIMMNDNPWSDVAFTMQVVCLVIAPAFLAAGVYLSVKHIVLHYGAQYSRLRPKLYTWIFIGCDVTSILIQALGGGLAAGGSGNTIDIGNWIIVAGIAFQVATMAVCGILSLDFFIRVYRRKTSVGSVQPSTGRSEVKESTDERERTDKRGQAFLTAIILAYFTILTRCIYRLPEMIGGWGNPLMRDEVQFLLLDGLMVLLATIAMTVCHPGFMFSRMRTWQK